MQNLKPKMQNLISVVIIIMLGIILYNQIKRPTQKTSLWTPDKQREYANKLKAEGLIREAITEYQKYLDTSNIDPQTESNIYYTIGKMAEEIGEYEKALAYFYKVELVWPETNIRQELGEHIISCLEKMGRGLDAQLALEKRTSLEQKEMGGKVIARIGKDQITDTQLNKELEKLPDWMKEEYNKPGKREEFLKQYIAKELLYRKAKRLGLDKDPLIRQKIEDIGKELIVEKLLEKEMEDRIKITPDQIELYYKANRDKYVEPAKVRISYKQEESGEEKEVWVEEGDEYIPGIGEAKELVELAFKTEPQNVVGPVKIEDKSYTIKVLEKSPKRQLPFEEVKDRVSYEYQLERQKTVFQELLDQTLKTEDVQIYGIQTTESTEKK